MGVVWTAANVPIIDVEVVRETATPEAETGGNSCKVHFLIHATIALVCGSVILLNMVVTIQ